MQVKKQQLESNTELTSSKLGKVYSKAVYCQSTYLTYKQSICIQNAGLDEAQVRIKIAGRNVNNHRYADTTLMAENAEELKSLLMRVKEESENAGLKLNIKKKKLSSWYPALSLHGK